MLEREFSFKNSTFFSNLSMNAYLDVVEFSEIYSDNYDIKFFNNGSTQCYAIWDDKDLIYSFRGTEPTKLADIKADIKFLKTESDSNGKVHRGFKQALDLIWDDLLNHHNHNITVRHVLTKNSERNVYFTGHSLGAALATLAAARLGDSVHNDIIGYTFGSPRVGNADFKKAFKPKFYRFRNNNDIVTRHPMEFVGFTHIGHFNYFDASGKHSHRFSRMFMFKQFIIGMLGGLKRFEIDSFHDHSIVKYCDLCKRRNI
jgi:hypothetical protein